MTKIVAVKNCQNKMGKKKGKKDKKDKKGKVAQVAPNDENTDPNQDRVTKNCNFYNVHE